MHNALSATCSTPKYIGDIELFPKTSLSRASFRMYPYLQDTTEIGAKVFVTAYEIQKLEAINFTRLKDYSFDDSTLVPRDEVPRPFFWRGGSGVPLHSHLPPLTMKTSLQMNVGTCLADDSNILLRSFLK
jgi:hypothetical protein